MKRIGFKFSVLNYLFLIVTVAVSFSSPLEDVLLKGNWDEVYKILEKDSTKASEPVARLIMGHACLATNRNNESMLLFLSVKEESDLKSWSDWTELLLNKYTQNSIAFYLVADAKARTDKLEEAKEYLTQALKVKEDFALAYNARGVINVLTNQRDSALIDLLQATKLAPDLADAYVNLGTYWVLEEAPDGALESFDNALKINPEFALAYNGKGCAYFGKGEFDNAAQNFQIALLLSPVFVAAEMNQGFASAYASRLVALGSMEKKPGTTLEFHQQYQGITEERQQQLMNLLPAQNDKEFWKKMDALPLILRSDDKTQALIKEYGLQKVQMGAFLKMQELKNQVIETNQQVQTLYSKISSYDKKIWNLQVAEFVTSLGFSALGVGSDLQKGWKYTQLKTEIEAEKGALSSITSNPTLKTVIDAIPMGISPISLASSIASSGFKIGRFVLEDNRGAANVEFERLSSEVPMLSTQLRSIETNLDKLGGTSVGQSPTIKSLSFIPGYYTSTDRPITEIGALASMVDKGIKSPEGLTRTALIVSQDPFRTNLLQSELGKYGFQSKVVLLDIDAQTEAKRIGADVILGIKADKSLQFGPNLTPVVMSQKQYDDNWKKLIPMFPPDKGGGAAGIPNLPKVSELPIQQNWDWGKSFIPTFPKGAPGGISTEELARSFVDKGNWPVMTSFSLFYMPATSIESKDEEIGK